VNCHELTTFLHAYVDGELPLSQALEVERHLEGCATCGRADAELRKLREAIQGADLYFPAPSALRARIRAPQGAAGAIKTRRFRVGNWLAVGAAFVLLATGGAWLFRLMWAGSSDEPLMQQLVASHVRSLMLASHKLDVESTDRHTVKPWFEGKLDYSPPVPDLADHGFGLIGGRLDYLDNKPVAALIYQRRNHTINVFLWPTDDASPSAPVLATRQTYQLVRWRQSGMVCWAVSNLNAAELQEFARLFQERMQ